MEETLSTAQTLTPEEKLEILENLLGPPRNFCPSAGAPPNSQSFSSLTVSGLLNACQMVIRRFVSEAAGIARLGVNTLFADTVFAENVTVENNLCIPSGTELPAFIPPAGCVFFLLPVNTGDFGDSSYSFLFVSNGTKWVLIGP